MSNTIDIYGRRNCPWCVRAKQFAEGQGLSFAYHDFTDAPEILDALLARAAQAGVAVQTVPQIFIGDAHIGGFDDFTKAHANGRVAQLLGD